VTQLDANDFTDPSARALLLRVLEIARTEARADWRPDLLDLATEEWLEEPSERVREALKDIERLTDPQVAAQIESMGRQLRSGRLSAELPELVVLAQDADPDALAQVKARIGQITSELGALRRQAAEAPRGPSALGSLPPVVPARFRAVDLSLPTPRPRAQPAPESRVAQLTVEPPDDLPFEEPDEDIDVGPPLEDV
jgi:hypothetical protein